MDMEKLLNPGEKTDSYTENELIRFASETNGAGEAIVVG